MGLKMNKKETKSLKICVEDLSAIIEFTFIYSAKLLGVSKRDLLSNFKLNKNLDENTISMEILFNDKNSAKEFFSMASTVLNDNIIFKDKDCLKPIFSMSNWDISYTNSEFLLKYICCCGNQFYTLCIKSSELLSIEKLYTILIGKYNSRVLVSDKIEQNKYLIFNAEYDIVAEEDYLKIRENIINMIKKDIKLSETEIKDIIKIIPKYNCKFINDFFENPMYMVAMSYFIKSGEFCLVEENLDICLARLGKELVH